MASATGTAGDATEGRFNAQAVYMANVPWPPSRPPSWEEAEFVAAKATPKEVDDLRDMDARVDPENLDPASLAWYNSKTARLEFLRKCKGWSNPIGTLIRGEDTVPRTTLVLSSQSLLA